MKYASLLGFSCFLLKWWDWDSENSAVLRVIVYWRLCTGLYWDSSKVLMVRKRLWALKEVWQSLRLIYNDTENSRFDLHVFHKIKYQNQRSIIHIMESIKSLKETHKRLFPNWSK